MRDHVGDALTLAYAQRMTAAVDQLLIGDGTGAPRSLADMPVGFEHRRPLPAPIPRREPGPAGVTHQRKRRRRNRR